MAERESAHGSGNQTKDRKRKHNFSVYEIEVITDNVKKNLDLIQSKLTNAVTNKKRQMLWEERTQAVNVVGTAKRTVTGKRQEEKSPQHRQERICRIQEEDQDNWRWSASKVAECCQQRDF